MHKAFVGIYKLKAVIMTFWEKKKKQGKGILKCQETHGAWKGRGGFLSVKIRPKHADINCLSLPSFLLM